MTPIYPPWFSPLKSHARFSEAVCSTCCRLRCERPTQHLHLDVTGQT